MVRHHRTTGAKRACCVRRTSAGPFHSPPSWPGAADREHFSPDLSPSHIARRKQATVAANDGQLAVSDIQRVLREAEKQKVIKASEYPGESLRFILELMCAFQLCYASEEGKNPKLLKPPWGFRRGADERPFTVRLAISWVVGDGSQAST